MTFEITNTVVYDTAALHVVEFLPDGTTEIPAAFSGRDNLALLSFEEAIQRCADARKPLVSWLA